MFKMICLLLALTVVALGGVITYDYTGVDMLYCNGVTNVNGNCPSNYTSDHVILTLTFSTPLGDNLSAANEATSPNLLGWSIHDVLNYASFSSSDANATTELITLSLSTDGSGNIDAWTIDISDLVHSVGGSEFYLVNPFIIGGGNGLPLTDSMAINGDNTAPDGWNANAGATAGQFTEATPEPSALLLISIGLLITFFIGRRPRPSRPVAE